MGRAIFFALVACAACAQTPIAPLAPIAPIDPPVVPDDSPIALRSSVVADEYFWLRTKVLEGEAPPAFADALSAMRDLRSDLGSDIRRMTIDPGGVRRTRITLAFHTAGR